MVSQSDEQKGLFFVEVRNPNEVRRNLLEAQKEIVESLQRNENIKFIRAKKGELIESLKSDIRNLLRQISRLKTTLPLVNLREAESKAREPKEAEPIKPKKKKHMKKPEKLPMPPKELPKPMSELEKLEAELSAIEQKLGSIK